MRTNKLPGAPRVRPLSGASIMAAVFAILLGCGGGGTATPDTTIAVATPSISPTSGTYMGTQQVTITDTTSGSAIYYTTDGTVPTNSSMLYTKPLAISVSSTVQATAFLSGTQSGVAQAKLTIAPLPTTLVFSQQPTNTQAGATISPAVIVEIEDANGNVVTGATNAVTIALSGGAALGGTLASNPQAGVATFSNLSISAAGTYSLTASSPNLSSASSSSFTVTPAPASLAFVQQPSNALAGSTITPSVTVAVKDSNGNVVTGATNPVTLAITSGSGLGGTLTVTSQNGLATFSNLNESAAGTYTIAAVSQGLISATSTAFTITGHSASGNLYYLAPNGNDSNTGVTPDQAWLTPNHSLKCGDTITAAAGSYSASNFDIGLWGTVTCPAATSVAWLQCETFDACKIATTTKQGMWIDASFWGVAGWEATVSNYQSGACFTVSPNYTAPINIHHIILANNVANGCMNGGFTAYSNSTTASFDYVAFIGNIAYNAAQGNGACTSGINMYQPIASDGASGTHLYVAGNFSYANFDPAICAGHSSTDGEGIIIDTLDFSQGGGSPYTQQVVVDNNMVLGNGSFGVEIYNNQAGSTQAPVYFRHLTSWGNMQDQNQVKSDSGEITVANAKQVQVEQSLAQAVSATGLGGNAIYALAIVDGDATDTVAQSLAFGVSGNNAYPTPFSLYILGTLNLIGTDPNFTNPAVPGAPSCSGMPNVPNCMASVIADFVPQTSSAVGLGYQAPISTPETDPLFPQWLCTANLPAGLISTPCN